MKYFNEISHALSARLVPVSHFAVVMEKFPSRELQLIVADCMNGCNLTPSVKSSYKLQRSPLISWANSWIVGYGMGETIASYITACCDGSMMPPDHSSKQ